MQQSVTPAISFQIVLHRKDQQSNFSFAPTVSIVRTTYALAKETR